MAAPVISWNAVQWEGFYNRATFAADRANIVVALGLVAAQDVNNTTPAAVAARNAVAAHLPLPHTPDDLSQTVAARCAALCNVGAFPAIFFRGAFNPQSPGPSEGSTSTFIITPAHGGHPSVYPTWQQVGTDWPGTINELNGIPLADRPATRFRFEVEFGNQYGGLNWSVERWAETIIHEIGIHVIQNLHEIERWRQGHTWPTADAEGRLDHLLFRFAGWPRYSLLLIQTLNPAQRVALLPSVTEWSQREVGRDRFARDLVSSFFRLTAPGNVAPYSYMDCLEVAVHLPPPVVQLFTDAAHATLVDKAQSQAFLAVVRAELGAIFQFNPATGVANPLTAALGWWW